MQLARVSLRAKRETSLVHMVVLLGYVLAVFLVPLFKLLFYRRMNRLFLFFSVPVLPVFLFVLLLFLLFFRSLDLLFALLRWLISLALELLLQIFLPLLVQLPVLLLCDNDLIVNLLEQV